MKNSYMNNEKCLGVEILYNLSFFVLNSKFLILNYYF